MKNKDIITIKDFELIEAGADLEKEVLVPFCCDLLSIAMSRTPAGAAWVTVMGNINTLAVATLTDASCIILAEGAQLDLPARAKAKEQGVTVFATALPIFEAALRIYKQLQC